MNVAERRGRKPDAAKDEAILVAARALFLERGYAVSMDEIAAAAGVSKQTLYARYPGKADLFAEIIRLSAEELTSTLDQAVAGEPERALTEFGERYLDLSFDPRRLALTRVLLAEIHTIGDVGRTFYERGPVFIREKLADYLRRAKDAGRLDIGDIDEAVSQFLGLIKGAEYQAAVMGLDPGFVARRLKSRVRNAVWAFLRIYGAGGGR